MTLTPSPLTAALAGAFSAIAWPMLWTATYDPASTFSLWLVIGTVLVVALPAHAFVMGFSRPAPQAGGRAVDTGLLVRVLAWVVAALVTVGVTHLLKGG
jgi:hypothetical protein